MVIVLLQQKSNKMKKVLFSLSLIAGTLVLMSSECKKKPNTTGAILLDCEYENGITLTNHNKNGVDYICDCEVYVSGGVFAVEEGVEINFGSSAGLRIAQNGTIKAVGSSSSPVIMRASEGSWKGIYVESEKDANELNFVRIENAGQKDFTTTIAGFSHDNKASVIAGGRLKITNSTITGSKGYGVAYLNSSTSLGFANNTINTSAGYPLFILASELNNTSLATCSFTGNGKNVLAIYGVTSNDDVDKAVDFIKTPIPYFAISSLNFLKPATMAAGTTIIMSNNQGIYVSGQEYLRINGTASEPVVIKGETETPGFWIGMAVKTNNPNNVFNYLHIFDGGSDEADFSAELANISMGASSTAQLTLNNCKSERYAGSCQVYAGHVSGFTNNSPDITLVCTP